MGVGNKGANGKERRKGERPGVSISAGLIGILARLL